MRLLGLWALAALSLACSSEGGEGAGSNTNWLTCEQTSDCRGGEVCVAHECAPVRSEPCAAGALLTLDSGGGELQARQGSFFANALYTPSVSDEEPADWVDPVTIADITARVVSADGEPLAGCTVSWFTAAEGGWLFPSSAATDAAGEVHARWIAGTAAVHPLTAALVDEDGQASSGDLTGHAAPHAPDTTEPTLAYVAGSLSEGATAVRIRIEPLAAPPHTFFATGLPDFFTGLQNTSELDAFAEDVAAEQRILIASVWNRAEGDAELLWSDPDVVCEPHDQGLGGIRCQLADAWRPGDVKDVLVELRALATDEPAPSEYAELGYAELTCTSAAGCLDYSVSIAEPDGEPRPVAALRIQSGAAPTGVSSYIDAYGESLAESCLTIPGHSARFAWAERVSSVLQPITTASYGASYEQWSNHVCANHGAMAHENGFTVFTGGDTLLRRPALPGDELQTLEAE